MAFGSLQTQLTSLATAWHAHEALPSGPVQIVVSPYRICPLGAHLDHQGGPVLGRTIDAYTLLAFVPQAGPEITLFSANFPGRADALVTGVPALDPGDWRRYLWGAVTVLAARHRLRHGILGLVHGALPGSGLSSSASVGLAYLHALAVANNLDLTPAEYVMLDHQLENGYLGLANGILDQATIMHGRADALAAIDTRRETVTHIPDPPDMNHYRFLVAYSGYPRALTSTAFNARVAECRQAAQQLGALAGQETAVLSDVPAARFERFQHRIPAPLRRRARHYYTEVARVAAAAAAWPQGDMARVGALMTASGQSSIQNYEAGSPALQQLQAIMQAAPGVLGARFAGGGFGGSVIGLVPTAGAETARRFVEAEYSVAHPGALGKAGTFLADFEDSVRLLEMAL